MGVNNIPKIAEMLLSNGKDPNTPVAIIERGLRDDQRVTAGTLGTIAEQAQDAGVKPPAIIVIGDVVRLYHEDRQSFINRN